jgi:hypothetical protein
MSRPVAGLAYEGGGTGAGSLGSALLSLLGEPSMEPGASTVVLHLNQVSYTNAVLLVVNLPSSEVRHDIRRE